MRSLFTLAIAAATLLPASLASPGPGLVQLDFHKRKVEASANRLSRRQTSKTANAQITNEEYLYLINVTVGTPAQQIGLQLDTGSSDIWFPSSSSTYCRRYGCPVGSYNQSASRTYSNPGLGAFQISYVDGTTVQGTYISDTLTVGGATVTNLTMASATSTGDQGYGIMGVGFTEDESSNSGTDGFTYPNINDALFTQGKINTRAYSLWLDDLASNTGSILFGGVDKSKYTGNLIAVPIQKDAQSNIYSSFTIAWTGLTVTGGGQTTNLNPGTPQPAILDSGTTLLYLPNTIANSIYNGVGVVTDNTYGNVVPCDYANDNLTFSFQFGGTNGPIVAVPLSEFVLPLYTSSGRVPSFRSGPYAGKTACTFGVEGAGTNPILFGDTFLRSAYVVYDLDNKAVALGQSNFNANANGQSVSAFVSGSGIPYATSTVSGVTVSASKTVYNGPQSQPTYTGTANPGDQATTRTPTFSLVKATGTTAGGAASTSSGAAAIVAVPSVQQSTFVVAGVTLFAFCVGGLLL